MLSVVSKRDELGVRPGRLLIDGRWEDAVEGGRWTHVHPATGEAIVEVVAARAADVDRAVRAARKAFDEGPWPRMTARERIRIMRRIVEAIYARTSEFEQLQTLDNGMPLLMASLSHEVSAGMMADMFDHYAGWIDKIAGQTLPPYAHEGTFTMTLREPAGVVGAIIPWNAPLILLSLKLAPALATGCTVVLKPSEYAPLCALRLGALLQEIGLPDGVVNIVTGTGPDAGEALITHPGVDKVTFTGSRAVGQHIMEVAGRDLKRVTLELGGKSAIIIFPDAPSLDMAAALMVGNVAMGLSGQGCVCQTRALVHEDIYDDMIERGLTVARAAKQGDPFSLETTSGPIINPKQLDRVMSYIRKGQEEGATLLYGGERLDGELGGGNWVQPTLFTDVRNDMTIAQEEIFGPVLAVLRFRNEEEAIRIANDSSYGLGGSLFTSDVGRALRIAKAVRVGTFGVNTYQVEPHAPFGGFKKSGLGREGSWECITAFTETKTVTINL